MTHWYEFVPTVSGIIATITSIYKGEWSVAVAMASFALFALCNSLLPDLVSAPVKFSFAAVGVTIIAIHIGRTYKKYKSFLSQ